MLVYFCFIYVRLCVFVLWLLADMQSIPYLSLADFNNPADLFFLLTFYATTAFFYENVLVLFRSSVDIFTYTVYSIPVELECLFRLSHIIIIISAIISIAKQQRYVWWQSDMISLVYVWFTHVKHKYSHPQTCWYGKFTEIGSGKRIVLIITGTFYAQCSKLDALVHSKSNR